MPNLKTASPKVEMYLYLNIYRHVLRSSLHENKSKSKKWCYKLATTLQPTTTNRSLP